MYNIYRNTNKFLMIIILDRIHDIITFLHEVIIPRLLISFVLVETSLCIISILVNI